MDMKINVCDEHGTTDMRNPGARPFLVRRSCYLATILACLISTKCYSQTKGPPTNSEPKATRSLAFDEDVGFDNTWAAEKKVTDLFKSEGFLMMGQPYTNGVENSIFKAGQLSTNGTTIDVRWELTDKGVVHYAYARAMYPHPATYRLSANRGSAACAVLMSVAGKISADRLLAIKEALQEFDSSQTPVVKVNGDFTKRGDFRVTVDRDRVQVENLWKGKGL